MKIIPQTDWFICCTLCFRLHVVLEFFESFLILFAIALLDTLSTYSFLENIARFAFATFFAFCICTMLLLLLVGGTVDWSRTVWNTITVLGILATRLWTLKFLDTVTRVSGNENIAIVANTLLYAVHGAYFWEIFRVGTVLVTGARCTAPVGVLSTFMFCYKELWKERVIELQISNSFIPVVVVVLSSAVKKKSNLIRIDYLRFIQT